MSSVEVDERVNLKEIVDISEDEFRRQISAWIDERGISRKLQSKLRADLFENFNRTKLGRQMTEQHQLAHRIVLSPLVLVLNTLVAEFLYTEDCHFTLSVFVNEVPYKNTLPNFEATPSRQLFRFSNSELNDIFEAIGISKQNEQVIRELYVKLAASDQEVLNKSLLYCILKTLMPQINRQSEKPGKVNKINKRVESSSKKSKPSTSSAVVVSTSSQQSLETSPTSKRKSSSNETSRVKCDSLQISSRYFKYLNRYLEILSDRINEMSKSLAEKRSGRKSQKATTDSSTQEDSLRRDLRKIIQNINKLTKSQRKSKRFQDVLNSIERLSGSVDKCSGKMEELLTVVNVQSKITETIEKKSNNKKDRFSDMDYASWLGELKTSEHGRKFIDRLEVSLQKTMEKERESLEKLYEEKTNNYRMLIRLHYKQKYDANKSECETGDHIEKGDSSPVDKITPDNTEKALAESLAAHAIEKEKQVDGIVQTAKSRLQQLERESEELDQSFQAYLRRQQILKEQKNEDASKIWENYSLGRAALLQFDKFEEKHSNATVYQKNLTDTIKIDQVFNSTFHDDVNVEEVLKDLNEIRRLKSPQFNKNEAFPKNSLLPLKSCGKKFGSFIDRKENFFEMQNRSEFRDNLIDKLIKPVSIDTVPVPTLRQYNEIIKLSTEIKLPEEKPKTNGTTIKISETHAKSNNNVEVKKCAKIKENIEIKQTIENEKQLENGNTAAKKNEKGDETFFWKSLDVEPTHSSLLTNGHGVEKIENKNGNAEIEIEQEEKEAKSNLPESPLKVNGFSTITEPKSNLTEKQPALAAANDEKLGSEIVTNGFSNKLTTFVSRISDSESGEMDSEQISIGQQRLVKSPEDFWI